MFDIVKEERPLTTSFIRELHQLVTRNQHYTEGRDQFDNNVQIKLLKGKYKITENNPTREDGTKILYCPPEQVASEMDNLIQLYNTNIQLHPLILATWFHHAFTTIHPFQDGNGRIARLLTSLIFIKFDYFPFTVLREEAKAKYIEALEQADQGQFQPLVTYFGEVQRRNIQKALNLKDVSSDSLAEVQSVLLQRIEALKHQKNQERQKLLATHRNEVFNYCESVLHELMHNLREKFKGDIRVDISSNSFDNLKYPYYFRNEIISYAKKHDYFFSRALPKAWLMIGLEVVENQKYKLGISIHHYGYNDTTLAIGSFLQFKKDERTDKDTVSLHAKKTIPSKQRGMRTDDDKDKVLPLDIPPHVISIADNIEAKKRNIRNYLENALTLALAQIASEI